MAGKSKVDDVYNFYFNTPGNKYDSRQVIEPGSVAEKYIQDMLSSDERKKRMGYENYLKAKEGDFSQFEKVSPPLRNYLASQYMNELDISHPEIGQAGPEHPEVKKLLEEQAMNPAFRLGCSLRAQSENYNKQNYTQYDDYMNSHIMARTLSPITPSQVQNLRKQGLKNDDLNDFIGKNVEKQVMVAKTLYMAHLGEAQVKSNKVVGGPSQGGGPAYEIVAAEPLDRPVASMAAHCSRTAYVFPPGPGPQQAELFESLTGSAKGNSADLVRRSSATHSVSSGPSVESFQEKKKLTLTNQFGMNIAIGGVGNPGISGPEGKPQILKNNGSCGHMYMHMDKGGPNKCGSLLIGFESDSPFTTNQMGHTHDLRATPESMSSFLGQRSDEMGIKYGGRIVDCTKVPMDKMKEAMDEFSSRYRSMLVEGMKKPQIRQQLDDINKSLCGKPMNAMELGNLMSSMGIDKEKTAGIINSAKNGAGITASALKDPAVTVNPLQKPKTPGPFTKFKAALGIGNAKKACEDYKAFRSQVGVNLLLMEASDKGAAKKTDPEKTSSREIASEQPSMASKLAKEAAENVHRKGVDSQQLEREEKGHMPPPRRLAGPPTFSMPTKPPVTKNPSGPKK